MKLPKQAALNLYYLATLARRRRLRQALEVEGRAPICVLFYHRVADTYPNDWTISNRAFIRQMSWIARRYPFVSLAEAQSRMQTGSNHRVCVHVTFDDGYAENCQRAIPWLLEHQIPFTYFVSTQFICQQCPFPHDVQLGRPLQPNAPDQLRAMANAGVEFGAHTRSHVDLGNVTDSDVMADEILGSKQDLEQITGCDVRYFAFPFGLPHNLNADAVRIAREGGFDGVCTAYGAYNFPGDDPFHVQRIHGDREVIRLKNWMTLDFRVLGGERRRQVDHAYFQTPGNALQKATV